MCTILPETKYPIRLSALGFDNLGLEGIVVREATSWSTYRADRLRREGDFFVGEARLAPGDMFLVLFQDLDGEEVEKAWRIRYSAGLVAEGERSKLVGERNNFFVVITDDPKFPVSSEGMPYPYNVVPIAA